MRKIILYADSYGDRVGQSMSYVDFLSQFGEVILVTPNNDFRFFVDNGDILALPGGADVDANRYGEKPYFSNTRTNTGFEYMDTHLLPMWIETGKPIIGICRGLQTLNVAMGGSLLQNIQGHLGDGGNSGEKRHKPHHRLYTDIDGYEIHPVNSFHHQAIKRLAVGFDMIGWTAILKGCPSLKFRRELMFGPMYEAIHNKHNQTTTVRKIRNNRGEEQDFMVIPEIIRHRELPYVAFQYHPEDFNDELAIKLINETLNHHFGEAEYPLAEDVEVFVEEPIEKKK